MSAHWSDEEIETLKRLSAQGLTDKEIGRMLGVSRNSVREKRFREGVKKPYLIDVREYAAYKGDEFLAIGTIKEISEETGYTIGTLEYATYPAHHRRARKNAVKLYKLEEANNVDIVEYANYIEQGLSHEDIAERKGYTNKEMKEALEKIGIVFDGDEADRYKKNVYRKWTKEEDDFLVENYKKMNNKELSVALGRTYGSIAQQKYKLGLTEIRGGYRQWTKEEDDYLRKNYKKMSDKELSIALGRTYPAIVQRKPILGLNKKLKEERIYVAYKGNDKIGVGTLDELAKKTGYARSTLYHCSKPSRRRRAGKQGLKLFEIEES